MSTLANAGVDILSKHKGTHSNALHISVERNYVDIIDQLIESKYPLDEAKKGGYTALMLAAKKNVDGTGQVQHDDHENNDDEDDTNDVIARKLIKAGANLNIISETGCTALTEAIKKDNRALVDFLIKKGANIFNSELSQKDQSAFYQAINEQKVWAVELFCDHGVDMENESIGGVTPLIYAAQKKFDEICMYLSLRTKRIDQEDQEGANVFVMYLLNQDILRCKQLIMRGADVNYANRDGHTPLHFAIVKAKSRGITDRTIKFLLKAGANPHIEDVRGEDCCDKAQRLGVFHSITTLHDGKCKANPQLRTKFNET